MATINTNIDNNSIDNRSFAILRTNPKLTSNAKLIVDSSGDIFLSSFKANKELSKIEYQKYELTGNSRYCDDIANFYKGLSSNVKYQTLRTASDITVYSDYASQYEDHYQYGAIHNTTKLYDEQYKIFAPIWLEKKVPTKFVVYRVEDADYSQSYEEDTSGQNGRIKELLKNSTIVKTFDLSKESKIGKYINSHVNEPEFTKGAISVNFNEGGESFFNGIDLVSGGFASKSEQLDKYYNQVDYPEIFSNQIITDGFERNQLAIANIINLEFLFDDNSAEDYKIYRYFGLYVDEHTEGYFETEGLSKGGLIGIKKDSYKTLYDIEGTILSDIDMFPTSEDFDVATLRWLKDKNGEFFNIKGASENPHKLIITKNGATKYNFEGYAKTGKSVVFSNTTPNYRGFIKLTIKDIPNQNDRIFIGDKTELEISEYNLGDYIVIADSSIQAGKSVDNRFSNQGTIAQIAIAMASAIENGEIVTYKTHVDGASIIIEDYAAGNKRRQNALGIYGLNSADFIQIDSAEQNNIGLIDSIVPPSTSTQFSDWDIYTMIGGAREGQMILVDSKEIGQLSVGDWVKKKDSEVFIQIVEIERDPLVTGFHRVVLSKPTKITNDNLFESYVPYKPSHGRFEVYDFKDFDFDFYSTRNSQLGDLLLDEKYDVNGDPIRNVNSFYIGLGGILEAETIDDDVEQENLSSEYDRLKENQLKETAIVSRVSPTICKFALKNASNARNLPYILNVNESFGEDNLSPNIEIDSDRKVELMNMEHFHINKIPNDLYSLNNDLSNYLDFAGDGGITLAKLKDTSFNYFERHFNWNGYYNNNNGDWYDNSFKKLWTKFDNGNNDKNSSTVFRGLRYIYKKRKETLNQIPTEFVSDSSLADYKFGVVLNYNNDSTIESSNVEINSVKNDVFKFICILIDVNVIDNDIPEIDRYLLYTLEDIEFGNNIVDTKIPFFIDFPASASTFGTQDQDATLSASQFAVLDGSAKFTEYIVSDNFGEYSWIYFSGAGNDWAVKVVSVNSDDTITVSGWPYKFDVGTKTIDDTLRLDPSQFSLIPINSDFFYLEGGKSGFSNLLNEVNAYNFANRFNKYFGVNYINIDKDSKETSNDYVLNIESGTNVIKPSLTIPSADPDRPKAYQLSSGEIGSIIEERKDGGYITLLRRMNGDYDPLFNDVITFSDSNSKCKVIQNEQKEEAIYKKFNRVPTGFDAYKNNTSDYGFINNYFYHKVNDEDSKNVIKLSQTTDKLPLYPKINEIAIDKKNINLFKSKYSSDYFTKSIAGGNSESVEGTLSPVEKKAFMASTIMKVKNSYDITKYNNTQESSREDLDDIRLNILNTTSIHWYEDESQVIADVYLPNAILNELKEDGILNKFKKYVDPQNSFGDKESIEDDLFVYANSNISPRFIIDNIDIYGIEEKSIETDFVSVTEVSELTNDSFRKLTNFNIQSYQNDGLSFRLIYNKRFGYSYKFKIHVKIEA